MQFQSGRLPPSLNSTVRHTKNISSLRLSQFLIPQQVAYLTLVVRQIGDPFVQLTPFGKAIGLMSQINTFSRSDVATCIAI